MNDRIQAIIAFIAFVAIIVGAVAYNLAIPVVVKNHCTGACMKVYSDKYSCDNLPPKYETVWGDPSKTIVTLPPYEEDVYVHYNDATGE